MNESTDRSLLFGILALQMDFISRDQLVSAMNAWVLEKGKALGEILVAAGAMALSDRDLLAQMVERHVQLHDNDPEKSLASVSWVGSSLRQRLEQLGDHDVAISLTHVASDHDPHLAETFTIGKSTSEGQRFRILRPHAKGGLGEVSVAHDNELNREVALKQIQARYADSEDRRARFVLEAEITGGLEHPGIVPVYGLGKSANGRPFYAMRFIRGDSLKEAIDRFHKADQPGGDSTERTLELRKLLGRFIGVCQAIEYAHSRGVLHRDLKPGNVMLGKYGETLVVDWGLAKSVGKIETQSQSDDPTIDPSSGSGSAPTQMGSAIGTPQYMSPEQAAGRIDRLGTASDVYSLGATLYCLLTGQAPFTDSDVGTVLRKVVKGDFPRPREIRSSIPASLDAICLKAMATTRDDRYPTPSELAADLESWLADEPISARSDSWNVRIARAIRRHPLMTTATAAGLFGAVLSLGLVFSILIPQQLKKVANDLNNSTQLPSGVQGDVELPRLVFAAGSAAETGTVGEKIRAYREAIDIQKRLLAAKPDVPQLHFDLAEYYEIAARFASGSGSIHDAMGFFERAVELRVNLIESFPEISSSKDRLAASYGDMAWILATCPDSEIRDGAKAVEFANKAHELKEMDHPAYLDTLAAAFAQLGDFDQATATAERAIAVSMADMKDELSERAELYKEGKAYVEPEAAFPSKIHD